MRRLVLVALLLTSVLAGFGEASGQACCRPLAMQGPSCAAGAAMPCCAQPGKMRAGGMELPAVPETAVALRPPASAQPGVSAALLLFEPVRTVVPEQSASALARPPRLGLALRSTLLI